MVDVRDLRSNERYTVTEPLTGSFGSVSVTILNLSDCGVQIEHANPLRLATKGRFWFRRAEIAISAQGIVVWSHLSRTPNDKGKYLYHSGVRVEEGLDELGQVIEKLSLIGVLRRDIDSLEKKVQRLQATEQAKKGQPMVRFLPHDNGVPADQALLIQHARARLRANPEEAARWYDRARNTIAQIESPQRTNMLGYHQDILAVWEYLERSIELPTILRVFERTPDGESKI